MGQQQLLLVILVTILVGIATVVGINVFGSSAANANQDAVRQDIAQMASSAQGFYIKPEQLGGGGNKYDGLTFRDITFPAEYITTDGDIASNANGIYVITTNADDDLEVKAYLASDPDFVAPTSATITEPTSGDFIIGKLTGSDLEILNVNDDGVN